MYSVCLLAWIWWTLLLSVSVVQRQILVSGMIQFDPPVGLIWSRFNLARIVSHSHFALVSPFINCVTSLLEQQGVLQSAPRWVRSDLSDRWHYQGSNLNSKCLDWSLFPYSNGPIRCKHGHSIIKKFTHHRVFCQRVQGARTAAANEPISGGTCRCAEREKSCLCSRGIWQKVGFCFVQKQTHKTL